MAIDHPAHFIQLAVQIGIIQFGDFHLKSGRRSPYFFNIGACFHGNDLTRLARCYAQTLISSQLPCDVLFGPAYKGIPLSVATVLSLSEHDQQNIAYAFNRKEQKTHGDTGHHVGAPLSGQLVLIDDVITSGETLFETVTWLRQTTEAQVTGIIVALDRQESLNSSDSKTASVRLSQRLSIPVISIASFEHIIHYCTQQDSKIPAHLVEALLQYRDQHITER